MVRAIIGEDNIYKINGDKTVTISKRVEISIPCKKTAEFTTSNTEGS